MLRVIHPALIHFPIALLLTAGVLTALHLRRPDAWLERSAYAALVVGWWGTLISVITGLLAAALQWPFAAGLLSWINWHAVTAFALLLTAGRAVLLRKRNPLLLNQQARRPYLVLLALTTVLVILTGWLGGYLVYDLHVGPVP